MDKNTFGQEISSKKCLVINKNVFGQEFCYKSSKLGFKKAKHSKFVLTVFTKIISWRKNDVFLCFFSFVEKYRSYFLCYIKNREFENLFLTKSDTDVVLEPFNKMNTRQKFVIKTTHLHGTRVSMKLTNFETSYSLTNCKCAFVIFSKAFFSKLQEHSWKFPENFIESSRKFVTNLFFHKLRREHSCCS